MAIQSNSHCNEKVEQSKSPLGHPVDNNTRRPEKLCGSIPSTKEWREGNPDFANWNNFKNSGNVTFSFLDRGQSIVDDISLFWHIWGG